MSSGTTTLINPDQDDIASAVTLIGFDFVFMGIRQDRFSVNAKRIAPARCHTDQHHVV